LGVGEQLGEREQVVRMVDADQRQAAGAAQLHRRVLFAAVHRLELHVADAALVDVRLRRVQAVERVGDRRLRRASRVAADRVLEKVIEGGDQLRHQRIDLVRGDDRRRLRRRVARPPGQQAA
jgi:hypothetical protein